MYKKLRRLVLYGLLLSALGCSLPPEVPVTREDLFRTGIYSYYTIKQSPESVLAALNRDGEVVIDATLKGQSLYVRLMVLESGIQVFAYEKYPMMHDKSGR